MIIDSLALVPTSCGRSGSNFNESRLQTFVNLDFLG